MKNDAEQSIAMSYVDTIMNSMGCLLVLFLLLTAVRGSLTFGTDEAAAADDRDEPTADGPAKPDRPERPRDVFVVLATAGDGGALFPETLDRGSEVWELAVKPAAADRDFGPSFALLALDAVPADRVRLKLLRPDLKAVRVRVVQGGQVLLDRPVDARDGTADVWPLAPLAPPAPEGKRP